MPLGQRLKRAAGTPLRQFFDRRFSALDTHVLQSSEQARGEFTRATDSLVGELDRRFERISFDVATVSRAHTESMSYVAAEIARLEATLSSEIDDLRRALAGDDAQLLEPYTLRALAPLPAGSTVLAVGHGTERGPLQLAALGHRVTALAAQPYPFAHAQLEVVTGTLDDFRAPEPFAALVIKAGDAASLRAAADVLAPGGLLVAHVDEPLERVDGFELLDQSAAGGETVGDAPTSGPALVTARRA
jgi:hypothetical protein